MVENLQKYYLVVIGLMTALNGQLYIFISCYLYKMDWPSYRNSDVLYIILS